MGARGDRQVRVGALTYGGGTPVKEKLGRLFTNSDGQSVVEYGLLISLVVLVIVTVVTAAQGQLGALVSTAAAVTPR